MIHIITHRGLEPSKEKFFTENSYEAFEDQLGRGFGIEFDVNFTKDGEIIIFHDSGLERITNGQNERMFGDLTLAGIKEIRPNGDRIPDFDELMDLIIKNDSKLNALHLKSKFQEKRYLELLLPFLQKYVGHLNRLLVFDVKVETARFLKGFFPELVLAPSVAHPYDIQRYNEAVGGTLLSLEEVIENKSLFDWAWLDEWDRVGEGGSNKKLYTEETIVLLRKNGIKSAIVSPELHGTSPGLLGGEAHNDAVNQETLRKRLIEIIGLKPNAICTDYPDLVKQLTKLNI
ncbi:MAG: Glycerophosphoryl diester phosphodiesterase [Candidatus Wolfebacteria bacterium GW2011_GWA1_44_24]|uniref:Glycerophosphoryl diester phosphodiesterase n=1 Tax=Candidatus Wolfebacteria bacterium GW2011_GWB1_41_12 TaxID=1619006 RepID=A0A0G0UK58_9BACT|nr:MAG: Glycerophosphoryl diester phosphodiesterase [Candidatus Wolfebacteria bacterium GW2011_GWB1_41_12]KKT56679.1 MAG: Glycerophosphoryl diester phosphodiesterase [Candidatus Wolfebacteria bacterium GW2011_GWA1_44_24]